MKIKYPKLGPPINDQFSGIREYPSGRKEWFLNDLLHREDGPAVETPDGRKQWWLNGECIYQLQPIGDYIIVENGDLCEWTWLDKQIINKKILTANGFMFIPDLPGI
ncbi:MAG: hypothetical protein EBT07_06615 [Actinobacteria bacterium]|nr:hypothetical protein [Actinomycetota bacterium]